MPLIVLENLEDPRLAVFSRMTDAELRDPKQLVGLARAVDRYDAARRNAASQDAEPHADRQVSAGAQAQAQAEAETQAPAGTRSQAEAKPQPELQSQPEARPERDAARSPERWRTGLLVAESRNVIDRACAAGLKPFALFVEECWLGATRTLADRLLAVDPDLPVFVANHELMSALTGYRATRGALAAFERPELPSVAELAKDARRIAVLEDVTNYTNIGAIFRSAAALGIDAVLVTPRCHDPFYRRASRVSMGTVFQVPWTRIEEDAWPDAALAQLGELGFKTAALALSDDSIPLQDPRLKEADKLALVLGTEGDGLAARTIARCDYTVRIPMDHGVDSLNVAAASAVAFWELRVAHRA